MEGKEGVRVHVRACALQAELRKGHSLVALRHAGSRLVLGRLENVFESVCLPNLSAIF
jgi:hypothetical protein